MPELGTLKKTYAVIQLARSLRAKLNMTAMIQVDF